MPHPTAYRSRGIVAAFEIAAVLAWGLRGLAFIVVPDAATRSVQGVGLAPWDEAWSLLFVLSAPIVIAGIATATPAVRIAGLQVLALGLLMNGVALVLLQPLDPRSYAPWVVLVAAIVRVQTVRGDAFAGRP